MTTKLSLYKAVSLAIFVSVTSFMPLPAKAAELLMLEQMGCSWCAKWKEEIGPIYPKTDEAKIAPLRMVDIDDPWPTDLHNIAKDQFTPTFVLVHEGKEIGRMRGYAGDEFFWTLLGEIIKKIPAQKTTSG